MRTNSSCRPLPESWRRFAVFLAFLGLSSGSVLGTVLTFEPFGRFPGVPVGALPGTYAQRVTAVDQDGFAYGTEAGWTPDIRVEFSTARLESDRVNSSERFGLRVEETGWNHGAAESALRALQGDSNSEQMIRVRLRGSDDRMPLLHGLDLVTRGGRPSVLPELLVGDGHLTVLYSTSNVAIPASGARTLRFDPPIKARVVHVWVRLGNAAVAVGLDNLVFGQTPVPPEVWVAETIRGNVDASGGRVLQSPRGIRHDADDRALVAWVESGAGGGAGTGWWARRESDGWKANQVTAFGAAPEFSVYSGRGGVAVALSTNDIPHLFHWTASFPANRLPLYSINRLDLNTVPRGPGQVIESLEQSASLPVTFDADGRASHPPDWVTLPDRGSLRWNGSAVLQPGPILLGNAARVRFRQGPERQVHVLYQTDNGMLRHNGGGPDRDQAILMGNTGSSAYSLAVDDANGVHVAAAEGTGRFFFGAVGRLAYLHSADGTHWTTNRFSSVPEDVGATAIALDSRGLPGIVFTRAFQALYFTRFDGRAWSPPELIRHSLGGWDSSKDLEFAFDARDRPRILVADNLTKRVLDLVLENESVPADLAVSSMVASTNRVAVGASVVLSVVVTNAGPRNATLSELRLRLPPEVVVRDPDPRPTGFQGSTYVYRLETVHAFESRTFRLTVGSLDPVAARIEAVVATETPDARSDNDVLVGIPTAFISSRCLADPSTPGCEALELAPAVVPPALANQPWSMPFRVPSAPLGAELRIGASTPMPPGFCLTADGELRGIQGAAGTFPLALDFFEPGGRVTSFKRDFTILGSIPVPVPDLFWSLDGHGVDVISGVPAALGARAAFGAGAVGPGIQSALDALNDGRPDLSLPVALFSAPPLFTNEAWGRGPVTVTAWMRRDDGARARGDARRYGYVLGLHDTVLDFDSRSVAFDPASGRLDLLSGPADFRAQVVQGPVLAGNLWHHLAWVNDGPSVSLYTNGVLAATGRFQRSIVDRPTLRAGGDAFGGAFSGSVDEVAVFRRVLSPEEVTSLAANPFPRRTALPSGGDFPIAPMVRELVLPDAAQGERYEATLEFAFCGTPRSLRLVQGALPAGLTLSRDGLVRGIPTTAGVSRFRVEARDAADAAAELNVLIATKPGLPSFTQQPTDQQVESGGVLLLTVQTRSDAALQWYFDDRPLEGETDAVLVRDDFSRGQAGRYRVRASNDAGFTWSREVRVTLRTVPEKPPVVELAPVVLRPDGSIRVRVATLRGRVYELQRALDLGAALAGGWRAVKRFLAEDIVGELDDLIPGRPGAAFYRVVEVIPPPAAPYSLDDPARYVGIAADGDARPGLLPAVDPATGRLGAFEYRVGGGLVGGNEGLILRLPRGAQPLEVDGATSLRFRRGELAFGDESPVQLDEGGSNRVVFDSASDLDVPAGPLSVETLERLLGKPRGSGVGLTFFGQFRFALVSGTFDGDRIRDAQLRWADRAAARIPTPDRTSSHVAFDIELSSTRLRIPFHGEFALTDGTRTPARITVPAGRPIWVELRPGPELALGGSGKVRFENGPEFAVEFTFDDPVFRGVIGADRLRLPEGLTLRELLGRIPPAVSPGAPPSGGARQLAAPSTAQYLSAIRGEARRAALKSCASSAAARRLLGEVEGRDEAVQDPGLDSDEDDDNQPHVTDGALAELRAWACVAEAHGRWDGVPDPAFFLDLVRRNVLMAVSDTYSGGPNVDHLRALTFAYRAGVLAEVAHIATLYPAEITDPAYLHLAVTDPAHGALLNRPNPPMQPFVDRAFEAFEEMRQSDLSTFDSATLKAAAESLAKFIAAANRNSTVVPLARAEAVQRQFEEVLRARAANLQRDLGVLPGRFDASQNPIVAGLKRYEALAYLRKALRIHAAILRSGADTGVGVASEVLSQLATRAWAELREQIVANTSQCTAPAYYRVLGAAPEVALIGRVGDLLGLRGATTDLPTSEDIARFTTAMERACAEAHPPVLLQDLFVRIDPARADEGRVLAVEGRLFWLHELPASVRVATPEIQEALRQAKTAFDPLFVPNALPIVESFRPGLLLRTLRVGMMQDNIRRRFRLPADPVWVQEQLPALTRVMKRKLRGPNLEVANRLLYLAAWRPRANANRVARGGALAASRARLAFEEHDDAPDDLVRRHAYLLAAIEGIRAEEEATLNLGDAAGIDRSSPDPVERLADMRLPGGLTIEKISGELIWHTGLRELSGNFRGDLQVPGAGLRLTLNRADFSTGGSFSGELFGSLAVPANQPVASLAIPSTRPARFALARGKAPELSGGGQLRLQNGATFDVFLSLADPVYRFSAAARGLRFQFSRATFEQWGLPVSTALDGPTAGRAIEYLTRAGLLAEGARPIPETAADTSRPTTVVTRPLPSDSDDLGAGSAALGLLTRSRALDTALAGSGPVRALAAAGAGSMPPAAIDKGRSLLRLLTEQLARANASMGDDMLALTQVAAAPAIDAEPVPGTESEALRRARVLEVARRLEEFGRHLGEITLELRTERGRELLGAATEKVAWENQVLSFVRAYRETLLAARDGLIEAVSAPEPGRGPWRPSRDWDRIAATNLVSAAQQYEATVEGLGITEAPLLQAGPEVGCSVFQVLLEERFGSLGLNPTTGAAAPSGGGLATHLALDSEQALEGLRDLLRYDFWNQGTPFCATDLQPRITAAIAAMVLRVRDLGVDELQRGVARVEAYTRKPWERAEFVETAVFRLLGAFDIPERLGLTRYPESTFAVKPRSTGEAIQEMRRDVADLGALLDGSLRQLAELSQDESSGYPAELRRRRGKRLPEAGPLARVLARYGDIPAVSALRTPLSRLAVVEAEILDVESSDPSFGTRLGRDAATFARRVLNAAAILDVPSGSRAALDRIGRQDAVTVRNLTDTVLARVRAELQANASLPWWVSASLARELQDASERSWAVPATRDRLVAGATSAYDDARGRVLGLGASQVTPPDWDMLLPGEIQVTRLFGRLTLNRSTRYVLFEIGGRLDFPNVRTADGGTAFVELQRLRLESTGQFALAAATRVPLPFAEASFAGTFRARGDLPRRTLAMSGDGTLTFLTRPVNPDTGQPFPSQVTAAASYEPAGYDDQGRPVGWRFAFSAGGTFSRSFGKDFALFGAGAGLIAGQSTEGNPIAGLTVGGSVGLFRKADRQAAEPPGPGDFHVLIENAGVEIVGTANEGGHAAVTHGTVRLPDTFYPVELPAGLACEGPGSRRVGTSVAIQSPIRVSYVAGGKPRLEGTVRFSHFGIRLGGGRLFANTTGVGRDSSYAALTVCQADLGIDPNGFPFLDISRAGLGFDVPSWDRGLLRLQNVHLGLDGRTQGELFLVEDFDLVRAEGLTVALLGAPAYADPAVRPPASCRGTGIDFDDVPGFDSPRVTLTGGVRVLLPTSLLSNTDGSRAGGFFCGGLRIEPTSDGPKLSAFVDELGLAGDFNAGPRGLRLRGARIAAGNFEGIFQPDPERPFYFSIGGDLQAGPFVFGLTDARLIYRGLDVPPALGLGALRFSRDSTAVLPRPFSLMPATVEFAELAFKRPSAPLAEMFAPQNLRVTASVRVGLPTLEKSFVGGAVSGVAFEFQEDGTPIPPSIDGFDLTVSSAAGLELPAFGDLGGKLRFGGFRRALADPNNLRADAIYAVGQLSGTQNGVKLGLLAAFNLIGPIGMCLDVNVGAAGIVLAPTPFQITGASGGFALLQTDNPCDFTEYFEFDTTTGTYRLKQTVELPPIGMPWQQFTSSLEAMKERIEGYASRFPVRGGAAADTGRHERQSAPASGEGKAPIDVGAQLDSKDGPELASVGLQDSSFPPGTFAAFGCPEECPPKTVAILCQPHPDREAFPDRVIFKLSSITEEQLTNAPPRGLGIDAATVRGWGQDGGRLGGEVASRLVESLRGVVPMPPSLPASIQTFLREQERVALEGVRIVASNAVARVAGGSPDAYATIRDELYRGMGCPDISLSIAGRMSMVGLSAFGWVEGRQTSSLSGSGGVIGELHALGVPVGEARAFISTTDANGLPNPSVCGQITASLGPFDFGRVDLAMRCENCVVEFVQMFPRIARAVGPAFLRVAVARVAPELESVAENPDAFLARWQLETEDRRGAIALGVLSRLASAEPELLPGNLATRLREAFAETWDRIRPQLVLCGEVTPRLLGLPLTLGGRSVALSVLGEKTGMIGEFGFAPSSFVPIFPPGDEATISFAYRMADTVTILLRSLDGTLTRPDSRNAFVREQANLFLENLVVAARYQWHPLGLELGDAAVRFLMPDLLDHPALPGNSWRNPDELTGTGIPSRDEVLVQAAASGKLGLAFDWLGTARDFGDIFAADDPRREQARQRGLDLRRTYFPHGGLVGGARMALPRLLTSAPSEWKPLYDEAVFGDDLFAQGTAALRLLDEFVLRTETNGTAAFYTPAPNPPLLYDPAGNRLTAARVRERILRQPDDFSPAGLVQQLKSLDFRAAGSLGHLYPDELSFLRAEMTNLTIFGVPVFGTARLTGRPSPVRLLDGAPLARLEIDVDGESPVGKVAGGGFQLGFDIYSTPEQSLLAWGRPLADELRQRNPIAGQVALAAAERRPLVAGALDRLLGELPSRLPRFATTNALPSLTIVDLRQWATGSGSPVVLGESNSGTGTGSSKGGRPSSGSGSIPAASPPVLRAELALHAFSPFYDPNTPGDGPVAEARRTGGFAASGRVEFFPDVPGRTGTGEAEFAVSVAGDLPRLSGRMRAVNLPTPFPGLNLANAQAEFDSQGSPFLRATTTLPELNLGPLFSLRHATQGRPLVAVVMLSRVASSPGAGGLGGSRGSFLESFANQIGLEVSPARLASDWVGGGIVFHGLGGVSQPMLLGESSWNARASLVSNASSPGLQTTGPASSPVTLRATLGGLRRDVARISGLPSAAFRVDGTGPETFQARLDASIPGSISIELFPGTSLPGLPAPTIRVGAPADGSLNLEFGSDGRFLVEGVLASGYDTGAPGIFGIGARVVIDPDGVVISGNLGSATGTLEAGYFDGQLRARFGGQLSFPPLSVLGGRVVLAAADGGNMTASLDAGSACIDGAVLTLQSFATAPPLRIPFSRFCLGQNRTFTDIAAAAPAAAAGPALHANSEPDLVVGAFVLENLHSLELSGGFDSGSLRLDYDATLKLGAILEVPIRGSVGTGGLRFVQNTTTTRLLGHEFANLRLGATNETGNLPEVGFTGRILSLPPGLSELDFTGRIPRSGGFSLTPANVVALPDLVPSFAMDQLRPSFQYRPEPYETVIRASQPSGYWPLGDGAGAMLDWHLASFAGTAASARRSGTVVGSVTRAEPGAFNPDENRGARFGGSTGHVRFDHDVLAPASDRFSASLWFRRAGTQARVSPHVLVARGGTWSLGLREPAAGQGTRLQFGLGDLARPDGGSLDWLYGRTRLDDSEWHHVAAVFDGGAMYLYLDGKLDGWQATSGAFAQSVGVSTTLGARLQGAVAQDAYNGWLDEVAIFPRALRPVEILGQWLAGGRSGLALDGRLPGNVLPGLGARGISGFLGPNGDAVLTLDSGGTIEFGGLRLPNFQGTVFRLGDAGTATFQAEIQTPRLDAASLGSVRGVFESEGRFTARAFAFADRGLLGWNLRLTNLVASGDWSRRTVAAQVGGNLILPYGIATLAVGGDLNTGDGTFALYGSAGGGLQFGPEFPFSYSVRPEVDQDRFRLPGTLALGPQFDAARFGTRLDVSKNGEVSASFGGETDWQEFLLVGHGRLSWTGSLGYDAGGLPKVEFKGRIGLSFPNHPERIEHLPEGLSDVVRTKPLVTLSFRSPERTMPVNRLGVATFQSDPPFKGRSFFPFQLR